MVKRRNAAAAPSLSQLAADRQSQHQSQQQSQQQHQEQDHGQAAVTAVATAAAPAATGRSSGGGAGAGVGVGGGGGSDDEGVVMYEAAEVEMRDDLVVGVGMILWWVLVDLVLGIGRFCGGYW